MSDELSDPRFSRIAFDPKFKPVQHAQRKVKVDKRFSAMFTDDAFKTNATKDKRGRPINVRQAEGLDRFYELENEEDEEGDEEEMREEKANRFKKNLKESEEESESESEVDEEEEEEEDDEEAEEEASDIDEEVKGAANELGSDWDELDKNAPTIDDATRRLAICNLDWQSVKASDLFPLLTSFLPLNGDQRVRKSGIISRRGEVKSVEIFPSQFGLVRMRIERTQGPTFGSKAGEEVHLNSEHHSVEEQHERAGPSSSNTNQQNSKASDQNEDDGSKKPKARSKRAFETERAALNRLRKYELERLKYYFAIVEFDSVTAAQHVYENCDNCEFESSGLRIDLRFVPDDVNFDDERKQRDAALAKDPDDFIWRLATKCTEMPLDTTDLSRLADAKAFSYSALQQTSKVELGWDRANSDRQRAITRANTISKNELEKMDLKAYLCDSEAESETSGAPEAAEEEGDEEAPAGSEKSEQSEKESDEESPKLDSKLKKRKKSKKLSEIEKYRALIKEIEDNEGRKGRKKKQKAGSEDEESGNESEDSQHYDMEVCWDAAFEEADRRRRTGQGSDDDDEEEEDRKGRKGAKTNVKQQRQKDLKDKKGSKKGRKWRDDADTEHVDEEERQRSAAHLNLIVATDSGAASRDAKNKFSFNARDERFSAIYNAPEFNVDPSAPEFRQAFATKRDAATYLSAVANEKAKRRRRM